MSNKISILGAGFIGKNLLDSYVGSGYQLCVLDHKPPPEGLHYGIKWIKGSWEEPEDVCRAIKGAQIVFHCVSGSTPRDGIDANKSNLNDVVLTVNLLDLCVQENVKKLVFISSAAVYGIQEKFPIPEIASTDPISAYGVQKLMIEKYLQLYKYQYGLDCKIMRLSNPYGRGQNVFGRQGFIAIAIGKLLTHEPIVVLGNGEAIRDYVYIHDVVRACHLLVVTHTEEIIFNIGSGKGVSVNNVLHELQKQAGQSLRINYVSARKDDIPANILDIQKAKKILGFEPSISLSEGLGRTISIYTQELLESKVKFRVQAQ